MSDLTGKLLVDTYTSLLRFEDDEPEVKAGGNAALQIKTGDNQITPIYLNTNRVGIGLSNPTEILHVDGNITQTSGDYLATDKVRALDGDGLALYDDGGNLWGSISFGDGVSESHKRMISILHKLLRSDPNGDAQVFGEVNHTTITSNSNEKLNQLRYKCSDMEVAPFMKIALEMINNGQGFPTYEELRLKEYEKLEIAFNERIRKKGE